MPIESTEQNTQKNEVDLEILKTTMSIEEIKKKLDYEDLFALGATSKEFKQTIQRLLNWNEKFKLHFPELYKDLQAKDNTDWYFEFQKAYKNEYENLRPSTKRLFAIIKESDIESLAKWPLSLDELETTQDRHNHSLLNCAQKISDPKILNYFFSKCLLSENIDDQNDFPIDKDKFISETFLYWAIALQQDYKKILYLLSEGHWPDTVGKTELQIKPELLNIKHDSNDTVGSKLLSMAAAAGHLPLIQYLKQQGIDLNSNCWTLHNLLHNTALHEAANAFLG